MVVLIIFELDTLHCRTGHYGICIIVRGDRSIKCKPIVAKTGRVAQFFEDVTNRELVQLLEDLDTWIIKGLKGIFNIFAHLTFHLTCTGFADGKKDTQECKKFCRNQLKSDLCQ